MALTVECGFNEGTGTTSANTVGGTVSISPAVWATPGHGSSAACVRTQNSNGFSVTLSATSGSPYTYMCWVRLDALSDWVSIIDDATGSAFGWLEVNASGALDWFNDNDGQLDGGTLTVGTWYHIAVTAGDGFRRLYVNGTQVASISSALQSSSLAKSVCCGTGNSAGSMSMDDLRAYNTVLSQAEIQTAMNTTVGGSEPDVRSGGSTAIVTVTASGGGHRVDAPASGGSTALVSVSASGSGRKVVRGGSEALVTITAESPTTFPPLITSVDGRRFLDQYGDPILLKGDSPWGLFQNASPSNAQAYLDMLAANGANAVLTQLLGAGESGANNEFAGYDDTPAFVGGDWTDPNETFWSRVDSLIDYAATKGITLLINPIFTGYSGSGVAPLLSQGSAAQTAFGTFLGTRYASKPNIIWAAGGDWEAADYTDYGALWNRIIDAERTASGNAHLWFVHNHGGGTTTDYSVSSDNPQSGSRTEFEFAYTYGKTYQVFREYDGELPIILGEANYEGENNTGGPSTNSAAIRRQVGWAYSCGAAGDIYGSSFWRLDSGSWSGSLPTAAWGQITAMRELMETLPWWNLRPSTTFITSGAGTDPSSGSMAGGGVDVLETDHATAAVADDGSLAVIYLPTQRTITVAGLDGDVTGTWFNASTGSTSSANLASLNPPSSGDWLLVLEAEPAVVSGGSTAPVTISATGTGHKVARGGSTATVTLSATGLGHKLIAAGSVAAVTVTATGGGHRVSNEGSGGSIASVFVTATGAGRKISHGGSTAVVRITATGSGRNPAAVITPWPDQLTFHADEPLTFWESLLSDQLVMTQGETAPRVLTFDDADLTGATAVLHVHQRGDRTVLLKSAPVTIIDAGAGKVQWTPDGTITAGTYEIDLELDGPGGVKIAQPRLLRVSAHASS